MNQKLVDIYRSVRDPRALVSQDQYQSANALLGSEVEAFAIALIKECSNFTDYTELLYKHFGIADDNTTP